MPRLIGSRAALHDMQRLHVSLAGKNPDAAKRAVEAIRDGVKTFGRNPGMGRPADEMDPGFREWLIDVGGSGYVMPCHHDAQETVILAVRHQRESGY